jgi:hypothetical protein
MVMGQRAGGPAFALRTTQHNSTQANAEVGRLAPKFSAGSAAGGQAEGEHFSDGLGVQPLRERVACNP